MKGPHRSDIRPGSAECRQSRSPIDPDQIRMLARAMRREKGLVLLDPGQVQDPWSRQVIEQEADRQMGAADRKGEA